MNEYLTIDSECQTTYEILRSVFLCTIKGIDSFDEGLEFCRHVAKKYTTATHNCYAIITFDSQKFSDDGEPQGTAGQPILQVLKNNSLYNVACVVTRYFGGIKLGAGGLVSAYTKSVTECLKNAKVIKKVKSYQGKLILDYNEFAQFNNYLLSNNYIITNAVYHDTVEIDFAVPTNVKQAVQDMVSSITAGKKSIDWIGQNYFVY
ncbi:MAG: YigZ family protein [Clostridiales bacterium]|nr:YigZ family protein [Clostridiales bacterium]